MFFFLLILCVTSPAAATPFKSDATTAQFSHWYPQFGFIFERILRDNCSAEYANYLTKMKDPDTIDIYGGGDLPSALTQPVVLCILTNTNDYIKSAMSSAQVLLGITPTILAVLGASANEVSLISIVAKRPFLALLLALGSPSVFLSRAFEYSDPLELLQDRRGRLRQYRPEKKARILIAAAQYVCAMAAIANVATVCWDLGTKTICSIWPDNVIAPLLWGALVVLGHVGGAVILRLQVRRTTYPTLGHDENRGMRMWLGEMRQRIKDLAKTEFRPACSQEDVYITAFPERKSYVVLSWALSTGVIVHVIFGTLVMSSLYFIGPRDALSVVGRYMASVLVCRVIVMYEIAGLRDRCAEILLKFDKPEERERFDADSVGYGATRVSNSVVSDHPVDYTLQLGQR